MHKPPFPEIDPPEEMVGVVRGIGAYTAFKNDKVYGAPRRFILPLEKGDTLQFAFSHDVYFDVMLIKQDGQRVPMRDSIGPDGTLSLRKFLDDFRTQ